VLFTDLGRYRYSYSRPRSLILYLVHFLDQELILSHYSSCLVVVAVFLVVVLFLIGSNFFRKVLGSVISNRMKFDRIVLQANAHRLTEWDF